MLNFHDYEYPLIMIIKNREKLHASGGCHKGFNAVPADPPWIQALSKSDGCAEDRISSNCQPERASKKNVHQSWKGVKEKAAAFYYRGLHKRILSHRFRLPKGADFSKIGSMFRGNT
jgi:hypothetical protein